jgi:RNA polymerase sigma factor (sigma-70 family)
VLRFKKAYRDIPYDDFRDAAQPAILRALRSFNPKKGRLKTLVDSAVTNELRKYAKRRVEMARRELPMSVGDDYDDECDDYYNRFDDAASHLAWKAATFEADSLSGLSELLDRLEAGNGKDAVTALLGGLTQKEISAQLHVSEPTVSRALASAYAKLRSLVDVPAAPDPGVLATRAKYGKLKQHPLGDSV